MNNVVGYVCKGTVVCHRKLRGMLHPSLHIDRLFAPPHISSDTYLPLGLSEGNPSSVCFRFGGSSDFRVSATRGVTRLIVVGLYRISGPSLIRLALMSCGR